MDALAGMLPMPCTLEARPAAADDPAGATGAEAVAVTVGGACIGMVPPAYAGCVALGEARVESMGDAWYASGMGVMHGWKVRALPKLRAMPEEEERRVD